jgi:hypothetical protein
MQRAAKSRQLFADTQQEAEKTARLLATAEEKEQSLERAAVIAGYSISFKTS